MVSAPQVGTIIDAIPPANPAKTGFGLEVAGEAMGGEAMGGEAMRGEGRAAQTRTITQSVVSQWWLICVPVPWVAATQANVMMVASPALAVPPLAVPPLAVPPLTVPPLAAARRQASHVMQAMPIVTRMANERADPTDRPVRLNHAVTMTRLPGGRNSKKPV